MKKIKQLKRKVKNTRDKEIRVKNGRAYFHWKAKAGEFTVEGVVPLGSDTEFIKRVRDEEKCRVIFV